MGLFSRPRSAKPFTRRRSRRPQGRNQQPELLEQRVLLSAGDILTSFGTNGFADPPGRSHSEAVVQADGRTVVIGRADDFSGDIVTRFNADGSVDTSFGSNGVTALRRATLMAQTPDGGFLVWGAGPVQINQASTSARTTDIGGLYKLNPNGQIDRDFGEDGFAVQPGFDGLRRIQTLTVLPDGKTLGTFFELPPAGAPPTADVLALVRFNTDGSIDQAYGTDGIAQVGVVDNIFGGTVALPTVLQRDGKIIVGANVTGTSGFPEDTLQIAVMRANADGTSDTSFGDNGMAVFRIGSGYADRLRDLMLRADGGIVVAAENQPNRNLVFRDIALATLTSDGQFDTSFSDDGKLVVPGTMGLDHAFLSADGRITTKDSDNDPAVTDLHRFNPDGSLDNTFGTNGVARISDGHFRSFLAELPDSTIIIGASGFQTEKGVLAVEGDGGAGSLQFVAGTVTVDEADGTATVVVSRSNGADGRVTVIAETVAAGSSASEGSDYVATSETLVFEEAETVASITVPLVDSAAVEGTEFINLRLRQPTGGSSLGVLETSRINIVDQAGTISFAADDFLAQESLPFGTLTFERTEGFAGPFEAEVRVVGGSASVDGDFEAPTQRVVFADGQRTATLQITMLDDDLEEGPEFAELEIVNPTNGALIGNGTARLRIIDAEVGVGQNSGALDRHFGVDGQVVAQFNGFQLTTSMARQPDGKVIVAGAHTPSGGNRDFGLTRFNADGSVDTTFGNDGLASLDFDAAADVINDVALQVDGKIVVVGTTELNRTRFAIARFNQDGSLDTSFGVDGKITEDFLDFAEAYGVAIDANGRIVVVGETGNVFRHDFAMARYDSNGRLDSSFGDGGLVTTSIDINSFGRAVRERFDSATSVAIQEDGRIVVGGTTEYAEEFNSVIISVADFAIARYLADGSLDPMFGTGGITVLDTDDSSPPPDDGTNNDTDRLNTLMIDPEGRILAAGSSDGDFLVTRLRQDGRKDESFGNLRGFQATGVQQASTGTRFRDEVNGMGILPDGDLILVGQSSSFRFGAVRLQEDGFYEDSFGANAVVEHPIDEAVDTTVLPSGRVLSAIQTSGNFGLAQILTETDCPLAGCLQFATVGFVANEDSGTATITVTRDPRTTSGEVTVDYTAVAGTATAGIDFTETSGTLTFSDGQQSATFEVELIDDDISEGTFRGSSRRIDETILLSLSNPTGGARLGSNNAVQLGIVDDDQPQLDFRIFSSPIQEDAGTAVVTVERRQINGIAPNEPASVDFTVVDGTATAGRDFEPLLGTVTFAPGQTTETIEIPLIADTEIEGEENFTVVLSNPQGGLLRRGDATTVRLLDTDPTNYDNAGRLFQPFGTDGIVTDFLGGGSPTYVNDAVRLADGKVIVAARSGRDSDFEIVKYNADGSRDTTFGNFGKAEKYRSFATNEAQAVRVLDNGKIVAAGYSLEGLVRSFVIVRFNADGTFDDTFGADGVRFHQQAWWTSGFNDVQIAPDGAVWFAGSIRSAEDFSSSNAIVRFGSDGELDTQFGSDGVLYAAEELGFFIRSIALANDGQLLVRGREQLVKLTPEGQLDTAFGNDGEASFPATDHPNSFPGFVQVLPDGSILGSRTTYPEDFSTIREELVKLTANGQPDTSFGTDGAAEWEGGLSVSGSAIEADGRIVLVGRVFGSVGARRVYANGDPDPGFGENGLSVLAQSGNAERVFVAEDGRLLLVGDSANRALLAQLRGGPDPGSFQFNSGNFEVAEDAGSITIPIHRVAGADGTARVTVRTRNGSALAGRDYRAVTQTLTFTDRELVKEITVPITDDAVAQGDLAFTVELLNPTNGATLNSIDTTEITITDDEAPGAFQFVSSIESADETDGTKTITVERIGGDGGRVTVDVVSTDGSATAGEDYTAVMQTLVFETGVTIQTFQVALTDDSGAEGDETLTLSLQNPTGGSSLAFRDQTRLTIVDDDAPGDPVVSLEAAEFNANEADGTATVNIVRSGDASEGLAVSITVAPDTAGTADFEPFSRQIVFEPGQTVVPVEVALKNDETAEPLEQAAIALFSPIGGALGEQSTAHLVIEDDDGNGEPTLTITDAQLIELDTGHQFMQFTVTRSNMNGSPSFDYETVDGTAVAEGDYLSVSGSRQFGEESGLTTTINVPVGGDELVERDETFFVRISNAEGATIRDGEGVGTIEDDDSATISIDDVAMNEGNDGTTTFTFTISIDGEVDEPVNFTASTENGTAAAGTDYTARANEPLMIRTSEMDAVFEVTVNGDTLFEPNETFFVQLANLDADGRDVTFANDRGQGTIRNDDERPDPPEGTCSGAVSGDGVFVADGILYVIGTNRSDRIHTREGAEQIRVTINGERTYVDREGITSLVMCALRGRDRLDRDGDTSLPSYIDGGGGWDRLDAGDGPDTVLGGRGNDIIRGNEGNDILEGGDGDDGLDGQEGNDQLIGGNGNDRLRGREGHDTLIGSDGNDLIYGYAGHDLLDGGSGVDTMYGGSGNDLVLGGTDGDILRGAAGHDLLVGNDGIDNLDGGTGRDILWGGNTSLDAMQLRSILDEWVENDRPLAQRIINIRGDESRSERHNGDAFLNATTLSNDAERDRLTGHSAADWFFAAELDVMNDYVGAIDELDRL